jgi:HSP20 family protein
VALVDAELSRRSAVFGQSFSSGGKAMALARYEPWNVMSQLQEEINRVFSNASEPNQGSSSATADWTPLVDINEYAERFELFVDLPGVDPKSVDITLDNDVLTLSGERAMQLPPGKDPQIVRQRSERRHGRFHRRFILPETVDTERVTATGRNGVLELTIAKQAKAQPRRIKVA